MKKITDKEYKSFQEYQKALLHGHIMTPAGLKIICDGLDRDPEKIGIHFLEVLAKLENNGDVY